MLLAAVPLMLSTAWAGSVHADHMAHPPALPHRSAARPSPPDTVPPPERIVFGYSAPWAGELADIDYARLTHLAVFNVDLNADATVSGMSNWDRLGPEAVALATPHGVKVQLALTCFDETVMEAVLPNPTLRGVLVSTLADAVDRAGADGISVDCEGVPSTLRDDLTALVVELQAAVDEVSIATPAVDWSDAFDKAALSAHADQIFIMGYDYHWGSGDPGPVAPLRGGDPWSDWSLAHTVDTYIREGAAPERIVLGLPLYGRTWPSTDNTIPGTATATGASLTMVEGMALSDIHGRAYDGVTDTPYTFASSTSQTWYDDPESIQIKVRWAVEAGLGGVGFWALHYEGNDPAFWQMVTDETTGLSGGEPEATDTGTTTDRGPEDGPDATPADSGYVVQPKGTRTTLGTTSCAGGALGWVAEQSLFFGLLLLRLLLRLQLTARHHLLPVARQHPRELMRRL